MGWFTGYGAEWAVSNGSSFAHYNVKYAKLDSSGNTAPLFDAQIISRSLGLIRFFRRPPAAACNLRFLRTLSMPLREEHRRTDAEGRCHFQCQPTRLPCRRRCNQRRIVAAEREWHAERGRSKRCLDASIRGASTSVRPSTHNPSVRRRTIRPHFPLPPVSPSRTAEPMERAFNEASICLSSRAREDRIKDGESGAPHPFFGIGG